MTSRTRRQLARVARLEEARRDNEASRIANDLRKKFGITDGAPRDPDTRRQIDDAIDRSPLAAEVRKKLIPPVVFNLTPNQMAALAEALRDENGNLRPLEEVAARAQKRLGLEAPATGDRSVSE